ncbi:helix-turn-helix transcriptional regulator [Aliterella atlantica]|uniref:Transcriptional regulator n=1 Tax=Aliterella atlantica CENA595 TaxID=1618023 RepID=A0A0D8ZLE4_9CYAN|nr:WYL domain-containing protein [Aliterella atlantica]KJH69560.1 transcriptional regulator [Aliterella atlantica CENA595]
MSRKGQSITLSISERDKAQLEEIALKFGILWGDRPNISKLVEAIARQQLAIAPNHDWSTNRLEALVQSVRTLTDAGKSEEALAIADLLLERSELSIPLRSQIERFKENLPPEWRLKIDNYRLRNQPFQLSYQDATGKTWSFTVRHAQINRHERGEYLDCWCEETEGNLDISELTNNWSLRLDRITEAAILPIKGEWHSTLAQIEVEMHIVGGLAFAYQTKTNEDIVNEWLEDKQGVRRVVKLISNTYWFTRYVLQNAPDIVVVSPESVRDRIKQKLQTSYSLYF